MSVDKLLFRFGDPGRYQILIFIMLWLSTYTWSMNSILTLFIIIPHPHHCKIPERFSINESIPRTETGELDSCLMYVDATNHSQGTISCTNGWEHFPADEDWSIVQEWDLVCEYSFLAVLANTAYFIGITTGALFFGHLSDKLGRKLVLLITLYSYVLVSIASGFSPNVSMYIVTRFLIGSLVQGCYNAAYVYSMEIFKAQHRAVIATHIQNAWSISTLMTVGLSYTLRNWKVLTFVISLPFVLTIIYIWILPECPRWLIAVGNVTRAKIELERFTRFNKLQPVENLEYEIKNIIEKSSKKSSKSYGIRHIFSGKKMTLITVASCSFFFFGVFAFYVIFYTISALGMNRYLCMLINGLCELFMVSCMYFLTTRFGRRTLARFWISLFCVLCFSVAIMQETLPSNVNSLKWIGTVSVIGRSMLVAFFLTAQLYFTELSPTVVRTSVNGMANFLGKIGSILAPQILLLENNIWKPLPFVLCGIFNLFSLLLTFVLPETRGKPLPEIISDLNKLWNNEIRIVKIKNNGEKHELTSNGDETEVFNNDWNSKK